MANDPIQGLIDYVNDIKPYHTKIVETAVGYAQNDTIDITFTDVLELGIELIIPSVTTGSPPVPLQICTGGWGAFWDRPSPFVVVGPNGGGAFPSSFIVIQGDFEDVFNDRTVFEIREPARYPSGAGSPTDGALTYSTSTGVYDSVTDTTVITLRGSPSFNEAGPGVPLGGGEFFFGPVIPPDVTLGDVFVTYNVLSTTATVGSPHDSNNTIVVEAQSNAEFEYGRGFEIRNASDPALNRFYNILTTQFLSATSLEIITTGTVPVSSVLDGELVFLSEGWDGPDFCNDIPTGLAQHFISDVLEQQWQCIGSPATNIGSPRIPSPGPSGNPGSPPVYPGGAKEAAFPFVENYFQHFILELGSPQSFVIEGDISDTLLGSISAGSPSLGSPSVVFEVIQAVRPVGSPPEYDPYPIVIGGSPVQKINVSLSDNNKPYSILSSTYDPVTNTTTIVVPESIPDPYPTGWIVPIGCGSTTAGSPPAVSGSPFVPAPPSEFNSPSNWTLIQAWDTNPGPGSPSTGDMTFIDAAFGGLPRGSGGFWNKDGTVLTLHSTSQDTTRSFAVPTPWDPDSIVSQISAFSATNESHLYANEDGTIMWSLGLGDEIKERALSGFAVTVSTELSDSNKADRGHSGSNDGGYYPNNDFTSLISDGGPSNRTAGSSIGSPAGDLDTLVNDEGVAFNLWTSNAGAIGGSKISNDGLKIYRGVGAQGIQTITLVTPFNVVGGTTVEDNIVAEITFRPKFVLVNPDDTTEVWIIGDNSGGLQLARMATNV